MDIQLQLFLSICAILFLFAAIWYIRKRGLDLYHSLMWFLGAALLLLMAVFPGPILALAGMTGIETPSNFVFLVLIAFLLLTSLAMSAAISRQHARIKHLVQSVAILENRLEEMEKGKPILADLSGEQTERNAS